MLLKRVMSLVILLFVLGASGCNNFEAEGPEVYIGFKGPKISAKKILPGENNGNEYLSRHSGIFGPSSLPMVGQNQLRRD